VLLAVALAFVFFCAHSNSRVQSGDQIPEEVVSNTIHLIIETPDLQAYAVQKLFTVLSKEILKVASLVPSLLPRGAHHHTRVVGALYSNRSYKLACGASVSLATC